MQNEIECMHKLNDAKIKIAQAEHTARMDLLAKQSLAAEAQIEFWNVASTVTKKNEHRFNNITDLARNAAYAASIQQTETASAEANE